MNLKQREIAWLGIDPDGCKDRKGKDDNRLLGYYQDSSDKVKEYLSNGSCYDLAMMTSCYNHWLKTKKEQQERINQQKTGVIPINEEPKKDELSPNHYYNRGEIVYADLGAFNYGYELCYPHPCVILSQTKLFASVIPCSTKKFGLKYQDILDGTQMDGFAENTGLILYGIRWISKTRIIAQMGQVSQSFYFRLESAILNFFPDIQAEIKHKDETIQQLKNTVTELKSELQTAAKQ